MASPVDICNLALQQIGTQSTVSSINPSDGSPEGNACSLFYTPMLQALHRSAHWNFARRQVNLTLLRAAVINGVVSDNPPPTPWLYEYIYPTDCLAVRFIMPYINPADSLPVPLTTGQSAVPVWFSGPQVPFVVSSDVNAQGAPIKVILCNMPQAQLVYTHDYTQQPNIWDAHFYTAASAYLAAWLVNPLSRNRSLWNDLFAIVKDVVGQARVSDGNEGVTTTDHLPDWMRIRGALGASGWYFDSQCYYGWSALGFPSGLTY